MLHLKTTTQLIDGGVGKIEIKFDEVLSPRALAIISHPHPCFGGTMDNKVVTTIAKSLNELQISTLRFNFRGVGKSEGVHDYGVGECQDLIILYNWLKNFHPSLPIYGCGFSFGALITANSCILEPAIIFHQLILIGMAIRPELYIRENLAHCENESANINIINPKPKVSDNSLIIHGALDTTIPLEDLLIWANPQKLKINLLAGADHYFHGRLGEIKKIIYQQIEIKS